MAVDAKLSMWCMRIFIGAFALRAGASFTSVRKYLRFESRGVHTSVRALEGVALGRLVCILQRCPSLCEYFIGDFCFYRDTIHV